MKYEYKELKLGDNIEKMIDIIGAENLKFNSLMVRIEYEEGDIDNKKTNYTYVSAHILTGKVVFIHTRNKEFHPVEDLKIGTLLTEKLKKKYELYLDEDSYNVYLSRKYEKFALILELGEESVNYTETVCGYTFDNQNSVNYLNEDKVKDYLECENFEDIFYSLNRYGIISVDLEKKEIIGELYRHRIVFDLFTKKLKIIKSIDTEENNNSTKTWLLDKLDEMKFGISFPTQEFCNKVKNFSEDKNFDMLGIILWFFDKKSHTMKFDTEEERDRDKVVERLYRLMNL